MGVANYVTFFYRQTRNRCVCKLFRHAKTNGQLHMSWRASISLGSQNSFVQSLGNNHPQVCTIVTFVNNNIIANYSSNSSTLPTQMIRIPRWSKYCLFHPPQPGTIVLGPYVPLAALPPTLLPTSVYPHSFLSPAYPDDFYKSSNRARIYRGPKFVTIHTHLRPRLALPSLGDVFHCAICNIRHVYLISAH